MLTVLLIFILLSVALDQVVKYLVVAQIPLNDTVPVLDGVFHLTHIRNAGIAFSMLQGGRWIFLVVTLAVLVIMGVAVKKQWVTHPVGLWALAAITGGAIGNFIDRIRLGYVIDMIEVEFVRFAVFNVADCFVSCGAVLLVIYILFFFDKEIHHDSDR